MTKDQLKYWLKLFKEYESPMSTILGILVVFTLLGTSAFFFRKLRQQTILPNVEVQSTTSPSPTPVIIPQVFELPESIFVYEKDGQFFVEDLPVRYIVQPGDSLEQVAVSFYKSVENSIDIQLANEIATGSGLEIGQELLIPDVPTRLPREVIERERAEEE